jgi:diguanylate cyclase (GGDEF)-like protein
VPWHPARDQPHRASGIALGTLFGLLAVFPWSMGLADHGRVGFLVGIAVGRDRPRLCAYLDRGVASTLTFLLAVMPMAGGLALSDVGPPRAKRRALELGVVALSARDLGGFGETAVVEAVLLAVVVATAATPSRVWLEARHPSRVDQLDKLPDTDPLTGCLKRKGSVTVEAETERAVRYDEPLSLFLADVDDFSRYDQTNGDAAGDATLVDLGSHLYNLVRASNVVGRIDADRFALLLMSTVLDPAPPRAWPRWRAGSRNVGAVAELGITMSIGLAALDVVEPTAQRLHEDVSTSRLDAPRGIALSSLLSLRLVTETSPGALETPREPARPCVVGDAADPGTQAIG